MTRLDNSNIALAPIPVRMKAKPQPCDQRIVSHEEPQSLPGARPLVVSRHFPDFHEVPDEPVDLLRLNASLVRQLLPARPLQESRITAFFRRHGLGDSL